MGSYADAVLNFYFASSTPDYVLAAFSAYRVPPLRGEAPDLPEPVVEPSGEGDFDLFHDEPWRQDWASNGDGFLRWSGSLWELHFRYSEKTNAVGISDALEWLAPFIAQRMPRQLVGYAHHDYDPCPFIFWVEDGQWSWQDMNTEDYFMERRPEAKGDGTALQALIDGLPSDRDALERRVPTDEERRHLRDLELAYEEASGAVDAKTSFYFPEARPLPAPVDEAYAAIEPFLARAHDAKVALLEAASKFAPPSSW